MAVAGRKSKAGQKAHSEAADGDFKKPNKSK